MLFSSLELLDPSKPILVFGRDGQLGKALQIYFKDLKAQVVFLGRDECDLANQDAVRRVLKHYQPQLIINVGAYTDVDKAESERDLAFAVNAVAPKIMAQYVSSVPHGVFVHYSTNYVFADTKVTAYRETDSVGPVDQLCFYGQTKLAGEQGIEEAFNLACNYRDAKCANMFSKYFILRTSWVYGDGDNFIRTMLRLVGECEQLNVVADHIGAPTSAKWLAELGLQLACSKIESGIYHAVPDGETSRHSLAVFAIQIAATASDSIKIKLENISPIPATDYPMSAKRPYNSCLNNSKLKRALSERLFANNYPCWQEHVATYVKEYVTTS
jgi:dTDP-4-dehydrorhamnose reductase